MRSTLVEKGFGNFYTKKQVDALIASLHLEVFFKNVASSDIATYLQLSMTEVTTAESDIATGSYNNGNDQAVTELIFATELGQPALAELLSGIYEFHVHAKTSSTAGLRTATLYAKIYERKADNSEVLVLTSEHTSVLTTILSEYDIHGSLSTNYVMSATTSRLVIKFFANIAGGAQSLTFGTADATSSGLEIPVTISALDARYSPKPHDIASSVQHNNVVLSVGNPGADTNIPTEKAIRTAIAAGGSMVYPGTGVAVSTGVAWDTSLVTADVSDAVSLKHARQHALDATADHTIGGLTNTYLIKSDGSKVVPATNTDAQVAAAVTASHAAVSLDANADTILSLSTQTLGLDTKAANLVLAGPVSGLAAVPAFRAPVSADISGLIYADRGDPNAYDFILTDLTVNNAWHTLDCHLIVPAGAKAIIFYVNISCNTANKNFNLRKNGNSNEFNLGQTTSQVANIAMIQHVICPCDTGRVVEYKANSAGITWNFINITILGWFM